jgi:hypothetical protein
MSDLSRFYFDLRFGDEEIVDEEGRDLPNLEAARREAARGIRSIVCADAMQGVLDLRGRLVLRDGGRAELLSIGFDEAFEITGTWRG